jgi:hypothetical protein
MEIKELTAKVQTAPQPPKGGLISAHKYNSS